MITALNGRMPAAMLVVADTGANGPQQLRADAAASWARMLAAGMPGRCLRSGYRDRAEQAAQDPALALPPGKSEHGEGIAADVDEDARSWIAANGRPHGWRIGFVPREEWHAQYDLPDQYATQHVPEEEPDMKPWLVHDTSGSMVALQFPDGTWAQVETNTAMQDLTEVFGRPREVDPITFARFCPPNRKRA